jgi:hypothetical protein
MKIELKNVKFYERMSEETNAFTADIFVNGKNVGYAKNDGHGGCTDYHHNSAKDREIIDAAEKHCLTLPPINYSFGEIDMNLENKIDQLFEEWLKAKGENKLQKKLQKDMLEALCIKRDGGYEMLTWKSGKIPLTIAQMLRVENGKKMLRDKIAEMRGQGRTVLNTNIPQELYQ